MDFGNIDRADSVGLESDECGKLAGWHKDFARLLFLPSTHKLLAASVSHTYSSALTFLLDL